MAAGTMCIAVSVACEAKTEFVAAICGGPPCVGTISSLSLRTTTAMEITTQIQNPDTSHSGWREVRDDWWRLVSICCMMPASSLAQGYQRIDVAGPSSRQIARQQGYRR